MELSSRMNLLKLSTDMQERVDPRALHQFLRSKESKSDLMTIDELTGRVYVK